MSLDPNTFMQISQLISTALDQVVYEQANAGQLNQMQVNMLRNCWNDNSVKMQYSEALVNRCRSQGITCILPQHVKADLYSNFIPKAIARAQQSMMMGGGMYGGNMWNNGMTMHPGNMCNNGGFGGFQATNAQSMWGGGNAYQQMPSATNNGWTGGGSATPGSGAGWTPATVAKPTGVNNPPAVDLNPPTVSKPQQYTSPVESGDPGDQEMRTDSTDGFSVISKVYKDYNGQRVNRFTVLCSDIRYNNLETIKRKIRTLSSLGDDRGRKYYGIYIFHEPVIVPIPKKTMLTKIEELSTLLNSEKAVLNPGEKLQFGGLREILGGIVTMNYQDKITLDRFLTQQVNYFLSAGRVADVAKPGRRMQISELNDLVSLCNKDTKDEADKQLQERIPNFFSNMEMLLEKALEKNILSMKARILDPMSQETLVAFQEVLPRFLKDRTTETYKPTFDYVLKKLESLAYVSGALTNKAEQAAKDLNAAIREFDDRYTVLVVPRIVIETNVEAFDLFRTDAQGMINPMVLADPRVSDVLYFTLYSLAGSEDDPNSHRFLPEEYLTYPKEMIVHQGIHSWNLKSGVSADTRLWIGPNPK